MAGKKRTILVTGGAGFIGSNTVTELLQRGFVVRVIDDLSFGFKRFVDEKAEFSQASLAEKAQLDKALAGVDVVMHFAASSIIKFSLEDPLSYVENNIANGVRLLEGMRRNSVKKIIFSSSASVYGEPLRVPVGEDHPTKPLQPYGASKLAFESLLSAYFHSFGIESVSLRFFNVYGPRDEQQPVTRAVPHWIKSCLKNKPVILNWGGKQLRDYVFVRDVAQAHIDVMDLKGCRVFNIGSGTGIVMKDLLEEIIRLTRSKSAVVDGGDRAGDPARLVADTDLIFKAVGWKPKVKLRDGLAETVEYYKKSS
jgi:UDP-glucose 4-epimerase